MVILATGLFSCKKETTHSIKASVINEAVAGDVGFIKTAFGTAASKEGTWTGAFQYRDTYGSLIKDESFINNGFAQIPEPDVTTWYYTGVYLPIPNDKYLNGDAIRIEARVVNSNNFSNFDPSYGRHSNVVLYGTTDTAWCAMNDPERTTALMYCQYSIGGVAVPNINAFLFSQQNWYALGMETKNQTLNFYKNNKEIYTASYNGFDALGRLKGISVYFFGSGKVDWVRLYDSQTGRLLMEENFDLQHKSHVMWF
jgi:hypothetical protein